MSSPAQGGFARVKPSVKELGRRLRDVRDDVERYFRLLKKGQDTEQRGEELRRRVANLRSFLEEHEPILELGRAAARAPKDQRHSVHAIRIDPRSRDSVLAQLFHGKSDLDSSRTLELHRAAGDVARLHWLGNYFIDVDEIEDDPWRAHYTRICCIGRESLRRYIDEAVDEVIRIEGRLSGARNAPNSSEDNPEVRFVVDRFEFRSEGATAWSEVGRECAKACLVVESIAAPAAVADVRRMARRLFHETQEDWTPESVKKRLAAGEQKGLLRAEKAGNKKMYTVTPNLSLVAFREVLLPSA